ncbi:hypothetical protein BJ878DRAFT_248651 [Calycina marina]|uniref:BTB domain-containing protein n=1 Tax=Calycina marina TaxID=1763456 RepID=A0A9P8CBM2_9HELO|nr:hypothetical protein BJ878DRAFT_248651 [Calycina marina]
MLDRSGKPCDAHSLVTFLVGPDPNPMKFLIHKEVVCHHSEVLAAAFNSSFQEGQTQTYRIEDTTERAFKLFTQWLYSRRLMLQQPFVSDATGYEKNDQEDQEDHEDQEQFMIELDEDMSLVELWVLADKFGMPLLQNDVLDSIHLILEDPEGQLPVQTFPYIFENTTPGSLLREYTISMCVRYMEPEALNQFDENFPRDLLFGMSLKYMELKEVVDVSKDGNEDKNSNALVVSDFYAK